MHELFCTMISFLSYMQGTIYAIIHMHVKEKSLTRKENIFSDGHVWIQIKRSWMCSEQYPILFFCGTWSKDLIVNRFKGPSNHSQPQDHERFWTFSLKFNYLQLNIYRRWNGGETISSTHQNSKCFQSIKFKSMNKFWPKFNSVSWSWGQVTKLALPSFDLVLCDHT